jgi:hypothetical protein
MARIATPAAISQRLRHLQPISRLGCFQAWKMAMNLVTRSNWLLAFTYLAVTNIAAQTAPPCGPTGGVTTATVEIRFIGPTDGVYFTNTEELIGPINLVLPARGSCIASCTMGPRGSCPGATLPTFSQCTIAAQTCAVAPGDSVLLTTTYVQEVPMFGNGFESVNDLPIFRDGFE